MYPSYTWPGAYSLGSEIKTIFKKIKESVEALIKRINKI